MEKKPAGQVMMNPFRVLTTCPHCGQTLEKEESFCKFNLNPQSKPRSHWRIPSNRSLEVSERQWYSFLMTTQFLTDDRGQRVAVVIPIADYESLMEDVADLAAVAERRDDNRISLNELKEQLTADGLLPR
jgi:hypothetical protein